MGTLPARTAPVADPAPAVGGTTTGWGEHGVEEAVGDAVDEAVEDEAADTEVVAGGAAPDRDDADGFTQLYELEWDGLVELAWSLTGSWMVSEEVVQDVFADVFRRWEMVGRLERPGAWARRAVVNRAISAHRRTRVEDRGMVLLRGRATSEADHAWTDRTSAAAMSGESSAFWAAVRELPQRQAACVALHYLEDLPVAEIAQTLGCTSATVKVHLHRGRQALSRRMTKEEGVR